MSDTACAATGGFGWPQWVMLALYAISALGYCIKAIRNRNISSGVATIAVLMILAWHAVCAFVLHAGGFW